MMLCKCGREMPNVPERLERLVKWCCRTCAMPKGPMRRVQVDFNKTIAPSSDFFDRMPGKGVER